jgi:tryptophanase
MFGHKDPHTGEPVFPRLELVRLAIPRRVYTTEHMRYVAEGVTELFRNRDRLGGLRITYEAPTLRHFTARLEEIRGAPMAQATGTR